jgi:hypothetical protein
MPPTPLLKTNDRHEKDEIMIKGRRKMCGNKEDVKGSKRCKQDIPIQKHRNPSVCLPVISVPPKTTTSKNLTNNGSFPMRKDSKPSRK